MRERANQSHHTWRRQAAGTERLQCASSPCVVQLRKAPEKIHPLLILLTEKWGPPLFFGIRKQMTFAHPHPWFDYARGFHFGIFIIGIIIIMLFFSPQFKKAIIISKPIIILLYRPLWR